MTRHSRRALALLAVVGAGGMAVVTTGCGSDAKSSDAKTVANDPAVPRAKAFVAKAEALQTEWTGPKSSPKPQPGKSVVYVTLDARNPGATQLQGGIEEGIKALGWKLKVIDGKGDPDTQRDALLQAIALKPDGIILGSIDAQQEAEPLRQAAKQGIPVVGWHSAAEPGPVKGLVFTDVQGGTSSDYGKYLGNLAIAETNGTARTVIITDHAYQIAKIRSQAMKATVEQCKGCKVTEYLNSPLAHAPERFQQVTTGVLQKHGTPLVFLTVTDFYYDFVVAALRAANVPNDKVKLIGNDGSDTAFARIRKGNEWEIGTVVEPIRLLGWQTLDELNRALAHKPWSGFIAGPHIVTTKNIQRDVTAQNYYEPKIPYRAEYKKLWGVGE